MINHQQQVNGALTSEAPAATTNGDNYVLAWTEADQSIWWITCPASTNQNSYDWEKKIQILGAASSGGPALANLNGHIWMVWKGENADTRIFIGSLKGSKWNLIGPISGIATSSAPALTSSGSELFLAWKGESDNQIYWSKSSDGKVWNAAPGNVQAQVPGAVSTDSPALAGYNGTVYLAWKGGGSAGQGMIWASWTAAGWGKPSAIFVGNLSDMGPALGVGDTGNVHLALKSITRSTIWTAVWTPANKQWSSIAIIPVVQTDERPSLASQASASTDVLLAWKGASTSDVWAGPLNALINQPVNYSFSVQQINIITQRSRNTESDTLYMTITVAVGSKPTIKKTFSLGEHHHGDVFSGDWSVLASVADDEKVVMSYVIINHGGSSTSAEILSTLESAGDTLAKAAIAVYATEASIAIGALANVVLPGFGAVVIPLLDSALIAVGDWLLSEVVGLFSLISPDCDGPVAAGVHAYTGSQLKKGTGTPGGAISFTTAVDNCVGVNSPKGCGDNSLYDINWDILGLYP